MTHGDRLWRGEHDTIVAASADRVWAIWQDVASWPAWNAGVERATLDGPFATGSTLAMTLPDGQEFVSVLRGVDEPRAFADETRIGDVYVTVEHLILPAGPDWVRVIYRTEVVGPWASDWGSHVTADFFDVLAALKLLAERSPAA